jgi:hypothetical protein
VSSEPPIQALITAAVTGRRDVGAGDRVEDSVDGVGEVDGLAGAGLAGVGVDVEVAVALGEHVGVSPRQPRGGG